MGNLHVLCDHDSAGISLELTHRYRSALRNGPGSALWITPTLRSALHVETILFAHPDSAFCKATVTPNVLSLEEFVEEIIGTNDPRALPLSAIGRRLLLDEVITGMLQEGELTYFETVYETRGFAEGLVSLVEELKQLEAWPARFLRAVNSRRENDDSGDEKVQQCASVYAKYQKQLVTNHLFDLEGRVWYAQDLIRRGFRAPFNEVREIFLDGFVRFTRSQLEIITLFTQWAENVWITLPHEAGKAREELFSIPHFTLGHLKRIPGCQVQVRETSNAPTLFDQRPAGLQHLKQHLFRPLREVPLAKHAEGVGVIEAPGALGEARMVARRIKRLLLDGTPAEEILVTLRELRGHVDLLEEVFQEYGIPLDVEGILPLSHHPLITILLKALRLPDEDWPFAGVTALLRSSFFRPAWPEVEADQDLLQKAEALLRLLGEPRHRESYLRAIRRWEAEQLPGLEDEDAEEHKRRHTHELAKECREFFERFFATWEGMPSQAPLEDHIAWLRTFTINAGFAPGEHHTANDHKAWTKLWSELDAWQRRHLQMHREVPPEERKLERRTFLRQLSALTMEGGTARTSRSSGRVRILSAPLARHLNAGHVFIMGLGERSFPHLAVPSTLLDEQERHSLRQHGIHFAGVGEMMADEMLLFYEIVIRSRERLVLSYPAIDDRGQDLLPSSFLNAILDCFEEGAVPVERKRMLIEGYDRVTPMSPAEHRVQLGLKLRSTFNRARGRSAEPSGTRNSGDSEDKGESLTSPELRVPLGSRDLRGPRAEADLLNNLLDASRLAQARFHDSEHGPYDGLFLNPDIIKELTNLFGPQKIFSPTALEDYVACPFRFYLGHVLRLEPLEEPKEEIEITRRGQAFHRALARLHTRLQKENIDELSDKVDAEVTSHLEEVIAEDVDRAPSPASKVLWTLEGQRMIRVGQKYRDQWQSFVKPWKPREIHPKPHFFEVDFGLPLAPDADEEKVMYDPLVICIDGIEVRVSGRIDRVDVAQMESGVGFWIIDYKTGSGSHYTGPAIKKLQRLQLPLYALAVQEVLLHEQNARPLGLAYWLVADTGAKVVLPSGKKLLWLDESEEWAKVREALQQWIITLVSNIRAGVYSLSPRDEDCTQLCNYGQICRITQARSVGKPEALPLPMIQ